MSDRVVRVVGPDGGREVSLPADTPIGRLLPEVLVAAGVGDDGEARPGDWRLARAASGDRALAPGSSLDESGVPDGATLFLAREPERSAPGIVDPRRKGFAARLAGAMRAFFAGSRPRPEAAPAAGDAPRRTGPSPTTLTAVPALTRRERARQAWRESDYMEQLNTLIAAPRLTRCATIAVVSPKGGVGKTTITGLLGMMLSIHRLDRVVAVDANPDEAQLGRAQHGLLVLPAPTDPARMWGLREREYTRIVERLQDYVGVLLLDCGTGLQEPSTSAAIGACDQCVLVTDADPAAASLVAEAGVMLAGSGRPITVVVNKLPAKRSFLALDEFKAAVPFATALTVLRNEPRAAGQLTTGRYDWRSAPESWQIGVRRLAVALTSEWAALGLTRP